MRMVYMGAWAAARFQSVNGRTLKPFNPMLGETFEVVTPTYRAITEAVSHHPPISATHCQGEGWTFYKSDQPVIKFGGKNIKVVMTHSSFVQFSDGEHFSIDYPSIVVGNILIGSTYVEPVGTCKITNHTTGEVCDIDHKPRGWTTKSVGVFNAQVKDRSGTTQYELSGRYTESIESKNVDTGETEVLWTAPEGPANSEMMYHMSKYSL